MAKSKYPVLTAIVGPSKGKRFVLKKDTYLCGADRKCPIRLKGEFVSDEHFSIKIREDGNWVAQNKSEYGTLVNAQRAETKILSDGDNIQVGTANVLVFTSAESTGPEISSDSKGAWSGKKLAIVAVAVLYAAAMVYVAMTLSGGGASSTGSSLGISRIDSAVAGTIEYMKTQHPGSTPVEKGVGATDSALRSSLYFRILDLQRAGLEQTKLDAEYSILEKELSSKMYSVYQLIATGQDQAALRLLDEVYATVPDVRAPITVLSLSLRTKIDRSLSDE